MRSIQDASRISFWRKAKIRSARARKHLDRHKRLQRLRIPRGQIRTSREARRAEIEELDIDQIVNAAQIYALTALDICNRERK